jgi:hypothetical protein
LKFLSNKPGLTLQKATTQPTLSNSQQAYSSHHQALFKHPAPGSIGEQRACDMQTAQQQLSTLLSPDTWAAAQQSTPLLWALLPHYNTKAKAAARRLQGQQLTSNSCCFNNRSLHICYTCERLAPLRLSHTTPSSSHHCCISQTVKLLCLTKIDSVEQLVWHPVEALGILGPCQHVQQDACCCAYRGASHVVQRLGIAVVAQEVGSSSQAQCSANLQSAVAA